MVDMQIRDDVVWAKHLRGDPKLYSAVQELRQNHMITLVVEGRAVLFCKMRDGTDGRPTPGLRPHEIFKDYWKSMQERRGEVVKIELAGETINPDPYLVAISHCLEEWLTPEDCAAFDDL